MEDKHEYRYPDLSGQTICFDFETLDPDLVEKGPSIYRGGGKIIGCGIATEGYSEYYNLDHPDITPKVRAKNLAYIKEVLALKSNKVGANLTYDYAFAKSAGMEVNGNLFDVQIAECLLNEYAKSYSLNALGVQYLGEQKKSKVAEAYAEKHGWKGAVAGHFWRMPSAVLREYGKADVEMPLKIFKRQKRLLEAEGSFDLFILECYLIKAMFKFTDAGVRIDAEKRDRNALNVKNTFEEIVYRHFKGVNISSSMQVAKLFDKIGIKYPTTAKGNPSITGDFLLSIKDNCELANHLYTAKKCRTELDNFLCGAFVDLLCPDGKLHGQYHITKSDFGGTKSGRLAMHKPNLQQVPGDRDPYFYKISREIFIPEEGQLWGKIDWSQIEYRVLSHYARGEHGERLRDTYRNDPETDYHKAIMEMTGLPRKQAKNLNFGILYGMGVAAVAKSLGLNLEEAQLVVDTYHERAPYVKETVEHIKKTAVNRGYLRTILNRKIHYNDEFVKVHSLPNRLIQGSAADIMKVAIAEATRAGLWEILTPHLTVHDEIDFSIPKTKGGVEATLELKNIMETCVKLRVPIIADLEIGTNWYNVSSDLGQLREIKSF